VSGGACSFYLNKSDGSFFGTMVKQASWDEKRRKGSVNKDSQITVKYSPQEISDIIFAIENKKDFSAYHSSTNVTKVGFSYAESGDKSGFHYNITQEPKEDSTQKKSIRVSLYYNEAFYLKKHLEYLLNEYFASEDAKYEARQAEYQAKQQSKQQSNAPAQEKADEEDPW
tara:strand:- start:11832 stop:12341 length:510 start_codon:yes stop_codon:yes gene_type:complete